MPTLRTSTTIDTTVGAPTTNTTAEAGSTMPADSLLHLGEGSNADAYAFPTEAAEKKRDAKRAAKAAGAEIVVKKKPKKIEDQYDD